eukprot:4539283-Pyramimonas_sp.AAC.1
MASKITQDSPTWLTIAINIPPRCSQQGHKTDPTVVGDPSGFLGEAEILQNRLDVSPFRFRCAFEASAWPQDGPIELQEGPERPSSLPQARPRSPPWGPNSAPRCYDDGYSGGS